ncbi:ABC transporter, ATP-binding protein [Lactobacillus ultunensis DSM 16047]|uniref:ABC transporter, ATP-binding protein n=2 Tax=Lactobacillus ultunensis TaxID=227945 RepID=C2EP81_9LACO|nr:ABC transporter, ATP-binding protein [Lactobacillus ultunensis DSM 16047]
MKRGGESMKILINNIVNRYKYRLLLLQFMSILDTLAVTLNVYLEGMLLNSLVYGKDRNNFFRVLVFIIILSVMRLVFSFFDSKIQILDFRKAILDSNDLVIEKLYSKDTLEILKKDPIKLTDQIVDDTNEVISFIFQTISQLISLSLTLVIILFYLLKANITYFWVMLSLLLIYTLCYFFLKPRMYTVNLNLKNKTSEYFSGLSDWIRRYVEIKGKEELKLNKLNLNTLKQNLLKVGRKDYVLSYIMSTLQIGIQLIFQIFLFIWGGILVISGEITIGYFSIVLQYFNQLLDKADEIFSILVKVESSRASYRRLDNLLHLKSEVNGSIKLNKIESISLKNVNISLDQNKYLFNSPVTYKFANPGFYTITGKNGIDKSILLRTITGIYNSKVVGNIFINDKLAEMVDRKDLRKAKLGFLFQDTGIPTCTVRDYLGNNVTEIKSRLFSQVFSSEKFNINNILYKPMDTLSSGELQLVKLYSALTKEKVDGLLLDEPLANIYPSMKRDIVQLLKEFAKDHLVIIISHDEEGLTDEKTLQVE